MLSDLNTAVVQLSIRRKFGMITSIELLRQNIELENTSQQDTKNITFFNELQMVLTALSQNVRVLLSLITQNLV